jgi:Response regulator containing CheY-like receiver and SARP domains
MRVIAVEDEKLSLMRIERILRGIGGIEFVAGYRAPDEALKNQDEDAADIAFLDVEMPGMNGLTLCERLTELNPYMDVVFVTAHEKYALEAYQANAIGYLLKPVQPEDVEKQVERIMRYRREIAPNAAPYIKTFGGFYVTEGRELLKFRTEKAEEMLALLVNRHGRPVSRDTVCNTLWPDMSAERATRNFHTTAYNIRHTFGETGLENVLLRTHESYSLDTKKIGSDLELFCAALVAGERTEQDLLEKAIEVYDGAYMAGRDYLWLAEDPAFYERAYEKLTLRLCGLREAQGDTQGAKALLYKLLAHIPTSEEACTRLLMLCASQGENAEAKTILENFEARYCAEFGEEPPASLRSLLPTKSC